MHSHLNDTNKWKEELVNLSRIALDCGLKEELRWGLPCFTFQENAVVLIQCYENCCSLLFPKGALLNDTHKILLQKSENEKAPREVKFVGLSEILNQESILKTYITEAIEIEKSKSI
jgi:uncharacterized protein YdeI (YjbR/CyaY-like superfamily)